MNVPLTPIRFLRYASEQFRDDVAVVCGDERFTYGQFADRAARLAGALRAEGVRSGDRIAFLSTNCHRLLEAYYGVLEADCVLLPLNVRLAPAELSYVLNNAGARFLFVEELLLPLADAFRRDVTGLERIYLLDGQPHTDWLSPNSYDQLIATASPYCREVMSVDENAVAELFYTSGTSDVPRGVMLTHRNIYLHALEVIAAGQTSQDLAATTSCNSVMMHTIPLFHANGWGTAHTITLVGGTHVMVHQFVPAEVFRLIEREKVTACALVPTMANALVNCADRSTYDLSSLQCVMIGGAASSPTLVREVQEKLGCACVSGYGLTETSPVLSVSRIKKGVHCQDADSRNERRARAGYAIPCVEVRVVDADERDVGIRQIDGGLHRVLGDAGAQHERPMTVQAKLEAPQEARAVHVEAELGVGQVGQVAPAIHDQERLVVLEDELGQVGGDLGGEDVVLLAHEHGLGHAARRSAPISLW